MENKESLPVDQPTKEFRPEVYPTGYAQKQPEQASYNDQVDRMIAASGTAGTVAVESEIDRSVA